MAAHVVNRILLLLRSCSTQVESISTTPKFPIHIFTVCLNMHCAHEFHSLI